ncbi:2775_t:CDS:2 [Funneliformis mosseae]|uniref:2775_t:CDS:1 n=1 Tax=Funneliformis mosseae TaxID=27381 RepID=A0A9N9BSF7_FUNMO|nr:2775_t:CDS:2 [Funneliformis mosseae]
MYEEMGEIITLNGIIKKLSSKSYFEVLIDKKESVFALKKTIYVKVKDSLLNNITGDISIKLYANMTVENVLRGSKISSLNLVKDVFDDINSSEIHIVIQDRRLVYVQN